MSYAQCARREQQAGSSQREPTSALQRFSTGNRREHRKATLTVNVRLEDHRSILGNRLLIKHRGSRDNLHVKRDFSHVWRKAKKKMLANLTSPSLSASNIPTMSCSCSSLHVKSCASATWRTSATDSCPRPRSAGRVETIFRTPSCKAFAICNICSSEHLSRALRMKLDSCSDPFS